MKSFRIITVSVNISSSDGAWTWSEWWFIHYSQLNPSICWNDQSLIFLVSIAQLSILSYLGNARMLPLPYIYFVFSWKLYLVIRIFVGSFQRFYIILFLIVITKAVFGHFLDSKLVAIVFNKLRINCKTKIN